MSDLDRSMTRSLWVLVAHISSKALLAFIRIDSNEIRGGNYSSLIVRKVGDGEKVLNIENKAQ